MVLKGTLVISLSLSQAEQKQKYKQAGGELCHAHAQHLLEVGLTKV